MAWTLFYLDESWVFFPPTCRALFRFPNGSAGLISKTPSPRDSLRETGRPF